MGVVVALILPIGTITQLLAEHRLPYFVSHPLMTLAALLWVLHAVVPALIGALPFLRAGHVRQNGEQLLA